MAINSNEDSVVIQLPKAQLDSVVEVVGMLNDLLAGAKQKAEGDIAEQEKMIAGAAGQGANPDNAQMVAELEAMQKGGY